MDAMRRGTLLSAVAALVVTGAMAGPVQGSPRAAVRSTLAAGSGRVVVVQAVPGVRVDLSVDGTPQRRSASPSEVLRPIELGPGTHELLFTGDAELGQVKTQVQVRAGSSVDVVLHRPASVGGAPVVNTYPTPSAPIGPGKSRLLLAHTATVPPADVRFDGSTVFTNIANGEFAKADVPAGRHRVALVPTGLDTAPILGPLEIQLAPLTATMVYAVGSPTTGSMKAIVHTVALEPDGSLAPDRIATGSAGDVSNVRVVPFSATSAHRLDPRVALAARTAARACRVGRALAR